MNFFDGDTKRWKKFAIVNAAALVGAFLAIPTLPGKTPIWMWSASTIFVIAVFNVVLYRRLPAKRQKDPLLGREV